jgi:hypothetical protein
MINECGTVGGIKIGRANQSTLKMCPGITHLHGLTWDQTWTTMMGS